MTRRSVTAQYPDATPELPPRSRGVIALLEENCTVCMLCARECPDWCIYIDSHKEVVPAPPGGTDQTRNVLDRFAIDFSLCMYCGICVEVCPFDALLLVPGVRVRRARHPRPDCTRRTSSASGCGRCPPPPAHDPHGEPAKEIEAARTAAQKAAAAAAADGGRPRHPGRPMTWARGGVRCCSALVAVGSALLVVTTRHLVHAGALAGASPSARWPGDYLVLTAEFVAWVQVLIYVGAVVVLLLFAVMLTRAPIGAPDDLDRRRAGRRRVGGGAGAAPARHHAGRRASADVRIDLDRAVAAPPRSPAPTVFRSWVLPFEVLSVLLLAALVGAIVLSRLGAGGR